MKPSGLDRLFKPHSIAVIGASPNPGNGYNAVRNLLDIGYGGEIFPVSQKYESVLGLRCYFALEKLRFFRSS